jgi:hypothetical protein
VLVLGLSACSGDDLSRSFGITRDTPDEFTVTTRAPLSMPPDFDLRPPRPGAPRPQEETAPDAAQAALVPQSALVDPQAGGSSPGQQALLAASGPRAPADIKQKIEHDAALDQPGESLTNRLEFWKKPPLPGVVVDPAKEAQRLRQNAALGQSEQTGDTPIIQRQTQDTGLLNGLF